MRGDTPIMVSFYDGTNPTPFYVATANIYRADLTAAGIGNGAHGFSFATPASIKVGGPHVIHARFAGSTGELASSPRAIPPQLPSADSVTPASGSGDRPTFVLKYTDLNGIENMGVAFMLNTSVWIYGGCYVSYSNNQLTVYKDDPQQWSAPVTLGSSQTQASNQCTIYGTGASATVSGNTLTLTVPLVLNPGWTGPLKGNYHVPHERR